MSALLLKNVHLDDYPEAQDVLMENGTISKVAPAGTLTDVPSEDVLDCEGRAVVPGFVETHLHLDKALLDERMPNLAGTLAGAIKVTGALKAKFTMEDVLERSRKVLDMAIAQGTTAIRTQPDVDPIARTIGADAMLTLRDEYRGLIDLQVEGQVLGFFHSMHKRAHLFYPLLSIQAFRFKTINMPAQALNHEFEFHQDITDPSEGFLGVLWNEPLTPFQIQLQRKCRLNDSVMKILGHTFPIFQDRPELVFTATTGLFSLFGLDQ